jgi:hypothetical protein
MNTQFDDFDTQIQCEELPQEDDHYGMMSRIMSDEPTETPEN